MTCLTSDLLELLIEPWCSWLLLYFSYELNVCLHRNTSKLRLVVYHLWVNLLLSILLPYSQTFGIISFTSPRNENSVHIYSCTCCLKPVWFSWNTKGEIMKTWSFFPMHLHLAEFKLQKKKKEEDAKPPASPPLESLTWTWEPNHSNWLCEPDHLIYCQYYTWNDPFIHK